MKQIDPNLNYYGNNIQDMMSFNPIYFSSPICTISDIIPRKMESQILIKHEEGSSLLASINQLPQSLIEHEEELQFMEVKIEDIPIVLVHNPSTCEVISFKDEIEKKSNQLIADLTQSPESLVHTLDTYVSESDGFSTNMYVQTLLGFAYLEGLASRRPEVLNGPWETLAWIIVKYLSFSQTQRIMEIYSFTRILPKSLS